MGIQGRLKDGSLSITGEVNERLPAIQNGLVAHYPFDGFAEGKSFKRNLLDTSQWIVGSKGSQGNFTVNGTIDENEVIVYKNPWGYDEPVWASLKNDATSDADGGWNITNIPIDNTKKYRLSVWIRRENFGTGSGSAYLGCQSSTVANLSNGVTNTNPYFISGNFAEIRDEWVLFVGYIHPHDYTGGTDTTNGMYYKNGTHIRNNFADFKWTPTAKVGGHRSYMYYSTKVDERQYWVRPRFELCDGTEPTIKDLLNNRDDVVYPILNTNTTLTNDYIAVEEYTKNTAGDISIYNNYSTSVPASLNKLQETYLGQPVYRLTMNLSNVSESVLDSFRNSLNSHGVFIKKSTFLANTKYASSIYWRPVNKHDTDFGGVASNMGQWKVGSNEYLSDGWRRYTRYLDGTMTSDRSDAIHHSFRCPSLKLGDIIMIDVCCPQTEQGRIFATSYIKNTRGEGLLKIPFTLKPPYSINLRYTGMKPKSEIIDQSSSPMIFQMGNYYTNASISFWNFTNKLRTYTKGDTGSGWSGYKNHLTFTDATWNNVEHMYTFVALDSRNFKVYMDGVYIGDHTSTVDVTSISYMFLGQSDSNYNANGKYRDLSIYSRVLTDDEIKKLNGQSFNLLENGNLKTVEIKESPNGIPKDAIHIPLDLNSKDRLNILNSSQDVNTVYEEGSVWVGTATKNEYIYPTFETSAPLGGWAHWGSAGVIGDFGQNTDKEFIFSPNRNYSHWVESKSNSPYPYLIHQSPSFTGGNRALQAIICMSDGSEVNDSKVYPRWNGINGGATNNKWTSIKRLGDSKWYLCSVEGISQDGSNNLVGIYVNPSYKIYIDTMQLENKHFCSPLTIDARGDSSLEFNLHRDYQLNWNEDWSIVYWKKPIGTTSNNLNGYSLESLGANSNSIGGGYTWWGKQFGSDSVRTTYTTSILNFNPIDYFNNWQMIYIVKFGNNISFGIKNDKMNDYNVNISTSIIDKPNYYVSQYGYDLKLGGYDNGNATNAYYKDLIVAKRALSNSELDNLYKTQMRATKDGLIIQNNIKENKIL